MEAKHTPGPWRVDENAGHWTVRCPCRGLEHVREADGNVCEVGYRPNAHLIAAAPDLLDAAKAFLAWWEDDHSKVPAGFAEIARAAIAKAEGR